MKKARSGGDELRQEYRREDLGKGVRGKYLAAYLKGSGRDAGSGLVLPFAAHHVHGRGARFRLPDEASG